MVSSVTVTAFVVISLGQCQFVRTAVNTPFIVVLATDFVNQVAEVVWLRSFLKATGELVVGVTVVFEDKQGMHN